MEEALPRSNIHGWAAAVHSGSMTLKKNSNFSFKIFDRKKKGKENFDQIE